MLTVIVYAVAILLALSGIAVLLYGVNAVRIERTCVEGRPTQQAGTYVLSGALGIAAAALLIVFFA